MRVNLRDLLRALPYEDRVALLICNVVEFERDNDAFSSVQRMASITSVMATFLSCNNRFRFAELLRDCAD
jgi:hypothetical protein